MRRALPGWTIAAFTLAGAGCHIGVCGKSRELHLESTAASVTSTLAIVDLVEDANSGSDGQWLSWTVQLVPYPDSPVTAARLRAGTPSSPGETLRDLPLLDHMPGAIVLTSGRIDIRREGGLSFEQWWQRLTRTPIYVEIVVAGEGTPISITLQVTRSHDWEDFYCD